MTMIRELEPEEIDRFANIVINAYPGFEITSKEKEENIKGYLKKILEEDENTDFYGLFRNGELMGGMRLHDFKMNYFSNIIDAGGIGLIAVDLLHKKEKVCKEIMEYFMKYCQKNGQYIALLYPFRPSFYKKMGFAYGPKMSHYRFKPEWSPNKGDKEKVVYLSDDDKEELKECYNHYVSKTHGMIKKTDFELRKIFGRYENRVVGYKEEDHLEGYMVFSFKRKNEENFIKNDLEIKELIYNSREALMGLFSFLNTQKDQFERIIMNTQDDDFYHILDEPLDEADKLIPSVYHQSNLQGVGLMYRIIDFEGLISQSQNRNFNDKNLTISIKIDDSFVEKNDKEWIVDFSDGVPSIDDQAQPECELRIDISELSSLFMGVVSFKSLFDYGLVEISDNDYLEIIDELFAVKKSPECITEF